MAHALYVRSKIFINISIPEALMACRLVATPLSVEMSFPEELKVTPITLLKGCFPLALIGEGE